MARKLAAAVLVVAAVGLFILAERHIGAEAIEFFRAQRAAIDAYVAASPLAAGFAFFTLYVAMAALSIPGAAVMTLIAGAVFGLRWGTLIVSFASAIGATLAFLLSRHLFRHRVRRKFGEKLKAIDDGVRREGAFYLFALRLVPAFPFFAINLAMGLTQMRTWTFYWVSQLGMLAGTLVYVYAGTQLGEFRVSWQLFAAFALLGVFPLVAKKTLDALTARRVYARWTRPRTFDRNMVVIGGGSAGLVAAYIAAAVKAKVTLVERDRMGGDCLNTGCVPSKALIRTARFLADTRRAERLGVASASVSFDFAGVMERVQRVIRAVEPHDSRERYEKLGVETLAGAATITSPWTVDVALADGSSRTLTTRSIVIATGAKPLVPPIPGLREIEPLTSETVWALRSLPKRLVVLGGGPIGCELAQCFARFGSEVTLVEMAPRLLVREDPDISERVEARFRGEAIRLLTGHRAARVEGKVLVAERDGGEVRIPFDAVLCALGRVPVTTGYGLEALGIPVTRTRTVETNAYLQTIYPNIYACGDVAGPFQFTHTASHQAWYAAVNALFGRFRKFRADYSVIPWATFTDPEVARVGLNETEAHERKVAYELTTFALDELDRAIADEEAEGIVKVLTAPGSDRILGATIAGAHAGDILSEFVLAMRHGLGLEKLLATIHVYPTFAEANKYAAGAWKRSHVSQRTLALLERYHAWTRA